MGKYSCQKLYCFISQNMQQLYNPYFSHSVDNFPPNISADATFRVNLGEESTFILFVEDPGDEFTLSVRGGLPENSVLEETDEGEFEFRWTLQEITTEPLVFIANDTRGASSVFVPTVEVCACVNGGNCTLDGLLTSDATVVMNCVCSDGMLIALFWLVNLNLHS